MALVTAPPFAIAEIKWTLVQPAQSNTSAWTGKRTVTANPWHGKWRASVKLKTEQGEANAWPTRGFLTSLAGTTNTFLLPATEGNQGIADTTVASGGAQGATTLVMAAARNINAGMLATVVLPSGKYQMVMVTASSSGTTMTFRPTLRESAAVGAAVMLASPVCQVALASEEYSWAVGSWRRYAIEFDVEEAF